jgi:hypothetical protein
MRTYRRNFTRFVLTIIALMLVALPIPYAISNGGPQAGGTPVIVPPQKEPDWSDWWGKDLKHYPHKEAPEPTPMIPVVKRHNPSIQQ